MDGTVSNLINGLSMLRACIDSQVLAGLDRERAHLQMFESYQARFIELPRLTVEHHMQLVTAVTHTPWSADKKQTLIDLIQGRTLRTQSTPKKRSDMQKCLQFENMITDALWDDLKNNTRTNHACAVLVACQGHKLGLVNASEKTLGRMIAIVGFVQKYQVLGQADVKKIKATIQDTLHGMSHMLPAEFPYLTEYIGTHPRRRVFLIVCLCTCLCYVCLFVCIFMYFCVRLCNCLFVRLFVCLFVCLLIC